jgi:predicted nuclease of predicted toxin-antitoxin system
MRILIDECLDWRLCRSLPEHECASVQRMGWDGLSNGELLSKAQREFDVFITGDRNLAFQQSAAKYDVAILVLHSPSIQLADMQPLMVRVVEALSQVEPGTVMDIYP